MNDWLKRDFRVAPSYTPYPVSVPQQQNNSAYPGFISNSFQQAPILTPGTNKYLMSGADNDSQYIAALPSLASPTEIAKQKGWSDWLPFQRQIDPENMSFMDKMVGGYDKQGNKYMGAGSTIFGLGKGAMDTWLGLKQLNLAEDSLDFEKQAFSQQFANQARLTNAQLRDRQMRRVQENPNAMSVDEYMKLNAVSGG